jgi:hypothetical protein
MAEAMARGFSNKGVAKASLMCCTDPAAARKELFQSFGVTPYSTVSEVPLRSTERFRESELLHHETGLQVARTTTTLFPAAGGSKQ